MSGTRQFSRRDQPRSSHPDAELLRQVESSLVDLSIPLRCLERRLSRIFRPSFLATNKLKPVQQPPTSSMNCYTFSLSIWDSSELQRRNWKKCKKYYFCPFKSLFSCSIVIVKKVVNHKVFYYCVQSYRDCHRGTYNMYQFESSAGS